MGQKDVTNQKIILIVDDDAALRSSLEFILGVEGYVVRAYACGRNFWTTPIFRITAVSWSTSGLVPNWQQYHQSLAS